MNIPTSTTSLLVSISLFSVAKASPIKLDSIKHPDFLNFDTIQSTIPVYEDLDFETRNYLNFNLFKPERSLLWYISYKCKHDEQHAGMREEIVGGDEMSEEFSERVPKFFHKFGFREGAVRQIV